MGARVAMLVVKPALVMSRPSRLYHTGQRPFLRVRPQASIATPLWSAVEAYLNDLHKGHQKGDFP